MNSGSAIWNKISAGRRRLGLQRSEPADAGELSKLREALLSNPSNAEARRCLADAHTEMGRNLEYFEDYDGAIAHFQEAARADPDNVEAHLRLGDTLKEMQPEQAIPHFREALRIKSDDFYACYWLAVLLFTINEFEVAALQFRLLLRISPDDSWEDDTEGLCDVQHWLGISLREVDELDGALAEFEAELLLEPNHPGANYELGLTLERKGERLAALEHYRQALGWRPHNQTLQAAYKRLSSELNK